MRHHNSNKNNGSRRTSPVTFTQTQRNAPVFAWVYLCNAKGVPLKQWALLQPNSRTFSHFGWKCKSVKGKEGRCSSFMIWGWPVCLSLPLSNLILNFQKLSHSSSYKLNVFSYYRIFSLFCPRWTIYVCMHKHSPVTVSSDRDDFMIDLAAYFYTISQL